MQKFINFFDKLTDVLQRVLSVALLVCCGIVFVSVVLRYFFRISFQWTEEVARYLHVWIVVLLMGPLLWTNGHISVDMVLLKLRGKARKIVRMIGELFSTFLVAYTFYWSILYVGGLMETGVLTYSTVFVMWMPALCLPIGFFLGTLFCVAILVREIAQFNQEDVTVSAIDAEIADALASNQPTPKDLSGPTNGN